MIQWKLSNLLAAHNLTAYRLAEETKGIVNRNTVYSIARGDATRVDLGTLFGVIRTLTRLTGQPVTPNDLLEVIEEPEHVFEEMDAETKAWHDADLSHLGSYEPYDWGDIDPMTLGKAVINGVVQE